MEQSIVTAIMKRVENGEGLNAIIESLGLDLHNTLLDIQANHRGEYTTAKQVQKDNTKNGLV